MGVEAGRGEAGIDRIDLDARILQFGRELHRQHVQSRLGGVVAEQLDRREFPPRIGIARQGAEPARHVDDPSRRRLLEERQHRLGDRQRAENIRLEDPANGVDAGPTRRPVGPVGDAGVVYEHVEPSVVRFDLGRGGQNCIGIAHLKAEEAGADSLRLEFADGGLAERDRPRADQRLGAVPAELARNLETDALVGAGDQDDPGGGGLMGELPVCGHFARTEPRNGSWRPINRITR